MLSDLNLVRGLFTVIAFATFVAIVLWAWSGSRRGSFDEAASLPFERQDDPAARGTP